jgi:hypothetical protein
MADIQKSTKIRAQFQPFSPFQLAAKPIKSEMLARKNPWQRPLPVRGGVQDR